MRKIVVLLVLIACISGQSFGQSSHERKMDSLQDLLKRATEDTIRLRLYTKLGEECEVKDNLKYAEPAIELADKLLSQKPDNSQRKAILSKKAFAYIILGVYNGGKDQFVHAMVKQKWDKTKAIEYFQKALQIYKEINDKEGIKNALISIAGYYNREGNSMKELEMYKEGLSLFKKMNDKKGVSRFIIQIANLYADIGDTLNALDYIQKAFLLEQEIGDTSRITMGLWITATFYKRMNYFEKALEYYFKAIPRYEAMNDKVALINLYFQIGDAYSKKNDLIHSLEYLQKSLFISAEIKLNEGLTVSLRSIGQIYVKQGDINKAIECHTRALKISEENKMGDIVFDCGDLAKDYLIQKNYKKAKEYSDRYVTLIQGNNIRGIIDAEDLAARVDSASGDYKEAYLHYKQYIILRDKINNEEVSKVATREKFQEEADRQKSEQEKKDMIAAAENRKQKIITGSVIAGLLLVLVFSGFVVRSLRLTKKQKQIIEQKNKETEEQKLEVIKQKHLIEEKQLEIIDSITYAKRLQQAILPTVEAVMERLPDSFIYYQPKDIVAGDFYWMHTTKDYTFIAAADCTGHGVPGAMVSVVCSNALNRAVNEFNLSDTGLILDKTRELVIETFEKSDSDVKDGMDISLLRIQNLSGEQKEIQWSGANNSLWYILHNELMEVKADKQPIGKYSEPTPFTTNNFSFNSHVPLYLFSDGYADQFSENDKKLMKKKFKEIVLSIQNLPMQEQVIHLENVHKDWKGTMEQTDDVLVIGIKI